MKAVSDYYDLSIEEIISTCQDGECIKSRHIIMYFYKECLRLSLSNIGKYFQGRTGPKDHATVLSAIKSVKNQMDTNRIYFSEIKNLEDKFEDILKMDEPKVTGETGDDLKGECFMENDCYQELIPEPAEIKPEKTIDKEPIYVSPFAGKEFKSHNYAGYLEHQI